MEEVFLRLAQAAARDANAAPGTPGRMNRQLLESGGMPYTHVHVASGAAPAAAALPAGMRGAVLLGPGQPALVRPMAHQVEMVEMAPVHLPPTAAATSPSEIIPHVPPLRTLAPGSSTRQAADSPRFSQIVPSSGAAAEGTYEIRAEDLGDMPRGPPSFCKQMGVLLRKRFTCARREHGQQLLAPHLTCPLSPSVAARPSLRLPSLAFYGCTPLTSLAMCQARQEGPPLAAAAARAAGGPRHALTLTLTLTLSLTPTLTLTLTPSQP